MVQRGLERALFPTRFGLGADERGTSNHTRANRGPVDRRPPRDSNLDLDRGALPAAGEF
jgi:hypothetical protein